MGKLKQIEIYFANNKSVYNPGDEVNGNIIIESRGQIKINSLKVFIKGIAKVHWTETKASGYRLGNYTEHFRSELEYICLKQTLIGGRENDTNPNQELGIKEFVCDGIHVFQFNFLLPRMKMATSFEGKHGSIRYFIVVELDKKWALNFKIKKLFTLINPVDVNQREYLTPIFNECSKSVCCWFCTSGPVSISVKTDRRGYCSGESVVLNALFENNSNRSVTPIANLYQIQTYNNANGKQFVITNKLTTLTGAIISPGSINEWNSKLLNIPATSPTLISMLIKVEYFIKVSVLIPGSYALHCLLPIFIGTVPFNGCYLSAFSMGRSVSSSTRLDAPPSYFETINNLKTENKSSKRLSSDLINLPESIIPPPYSEFDTIKTD